MDDCANKIPGYTKFANKKALKLAKWALEEKNRVKASKLKMAADNMEDKYRNSREFKFKKKMLEKGNIGYYPLYSDLLFDIGKVYPPPFTARNIK